MRNHRTSISAKINTGSDLVDSLIMLTVIAFFLSMPVAWITHVVWIIRKLGGDTGATVGQMVLGGLGAFMPPIGVLHGYMIWFGAGF